MKTEYPPPEMWEEWLQQKLEEDRGWAADEKVVNSIVLKMA